MTIRKGESWGEQVDRPSDLRVVGSDAELASNLAADNSVPVAAEAGDMFRTLGARPLADRSELHRFPVDLVDVLLDGEPAGTAVAHVIARSPRLRGGWWRGRVLAVMNAEFVGSFDVAPRGHPNDGRAEVLDAAAQLSMRQRLAIRKRLLTGTHLPHPLISTRSVRTGSWSFDLPRDVFADGRRIGRATRVEITVRLDAAELYA